MSVTPWKACVLQSFLTVTTERKTNEATAANYLAWLHFLSVGLTSVGFFFFLSPFIASSDRELTHALLSWELSLRSSKLNICETLTKSFYLIPPPPGRLRKKRHQKKKRFFFSFLKYLMSGIWSSPRIYSR